MDEFALVRPNAFESLKDDASRLIQNKVFLGRYIERRYVESLAAYRDIIVVESSDSIVPSLKEITRALGACYDNKWIGITRDPENRESEDCLLWVQLSDVPIGKHWFQMSAIRFDPKEIILEIQYIQPYSSPDQSITDDPNFPSFDPKEIFTQDNIREAIRFSAILLITLFTFTVEALRYLGEYSIKLSYVILNFMHVLTPWFLGLLDFLTKCVGGLYWLVFVLIRGTPNTPVVPAALMINRGPTGYNRSYRSLSNRSNDFTNARQNYGSNWNKYQR